MSTAGDRSLADRSARRLRNGLRARGEDVQLGLQRYAVERFLYRLGALAAPRALRAEGRDALRALGRDAPTGRRATSTSRATAADDDRGDPRATSARSAPSRTDDDGLAFDATTLTVGADPRRGRVRRPARLDRAPGSATRDIPMQIDVGFGNAIVAGARPDAEYPTLLDAPAAPHPRLSARGGRRREARTRWSSSESATAATRTSTTSTRSRARFRVRAAHARREAVAATLRAPPHARSTPQDSRPLTSRPSTADELALRSGVRYLTQQGLARRPGGLRQVASSRSGLDAFPAPGLLRRIGSSRSESAGGIWQAWRAVAMTAARFKPYPAYKDSGVEWLGEIPAHWEESKRLKFLGRSHQWVPPSSP